MYSYLANPNETKAVLSQHGLSAKYKLGQNFLVSDEVIGKILELSAIDSNDCVLEVGPGIGTLTCAMLPVAEAVVSIEADKDLKSVLSETLAQDSDRFALIMGDALKVEPSDIAEAIESIPYENLHGMPTCFVANLPYQVAATLILKYIETIPSLERICVMVQAEVADRISAKPGNKIYGAYTAKLNLFGEVTGRFEVGPHNFMPAPHVDSAVVRIDRDPYTRCDGSTLTSDELKFTASVIDAAFALRRKTIRNSMSNKGFYKDLLDKAFEIADIAPNIRAEKLNVDDFVRLADALTSLN